MVTLLERGVTMAAYTVDGYSGIAWYSRGHAKTWTEETWELIEGEDPECEHSYIYSEGEEIEDQDKLIMVMIGDDREFTFDKDEVHKLDDLAYCAECGQIGCTHDGRER